MTETLDNQQGNENGRKAVEELVKIFEILFKPAISAEEALLRSLFGGPESGEEAPETGFDIETSPAETATFDDSDLDVEYESGRIVIQRKASTLDRETSLEQWIDTGFDVDFDDIDDVRRDFPAETYRKILVLDESVDVDPLEDPYFDEELAEDSAALILENDELKEEILQLKALVSDKEGEISALKTQIEEAGALLNSALRDRNRVAKGIDNVHSAIHALNDLIEELPSLWNGNALKLKEVAQKLGVIWHFNLEFIAEKYLPKE